MKMQNEMRIFENEQFGSVRTLTEENGRILFSASDVAKMLGYANYRDAIKRHCKGVVKHDALTLNQNRYGTTTKQVMEINYIPEPDIYRLIFKSKLPCAQDFEKWVVEEVLPTLRKTGKYAMPKEVLDIVDYHNTAIDTANLTGIRITAKILGIPERLFSFLLIEMGFAYRRKGVLIPTAFMTRNGYAKLQEYSNKKSSGVRCYFTFTGRAYLLKRFKKNFAIR